ncbi:LamG domain-containing protein [Streptomyces sp. NPDC050743]|uniref:LamG domain-containing protein n=1 Tax=Streptomyces sp. NPDC050743 TaxID=3365634 RepID=UPI0037BBD22C
MTPPLGRRSFLTVAGATAAALTATDGLPTQAAPPRTGSPHQQTARATPFPLTAVTLLPGPFRAPDPAERRGHAALRDHHGRRRCRAAHRRDPLPTGRGVRLAVTYGSGAAVLYVDGREAGRNTAVTVEPRYSGNHIRAAYVGKSQYPDPCLKAAVDDFRVCGKTLTAAEVRALAQGA